MTAKKYRCAIWTSSIDGTKGRTYQRKIQDYTRAGLKRLVADRRAHGYTIQRVFRLTKPKVDEPFFFIEFITREAKWFSRRVTEEI